MGTFLDTLSFPARVRKDLGEVFLKKDKEPVFITCKSCNRRALKKEWQENFYVCPVCGSYRPVGAYYRLSLILDKGSFMELSELREQIDGIDEQIVALYEKRMAVSDRIADVKIQSGISK